MASENLNREDPQPLFPLAGQTNRSWREQSLTRASEMQTLLAWFKSVPVPAEEPSATAAEYRDLDAAIGLHLKAAQQAADGNSKWWEIRNGAIIERVMSHLDAAEADLLRRAPAKYLCGQISRILSHVRQHLPTDDPQRIRVEELSQEVCKGHLDAYARETLIHAVRAASLEARREFTRVRSFRNVLLVTAATLTVAAVGTALWGAAWPEHLQLCFNPQETQQQVCPVGDDPTSADIVLIQFIGLLAAAVSGSAALRHVSGTSTRLGLPVALAVLKLPSGALTAFLGLLLMRGGFVPGLSDLDSRAQILAWAVVFGAAQQLVTGLVDRQADHVLNQVGGKAHSQPG